MLKLKPSLMMIEKQVDRAVGILEEIIREAVKTELFDEL